MSVLIVEDSDACAATLEIALEGMGTVRVRTTEAALALLEELSPAAVVTDLNLPGASGYELIRHLRASPRHRSTPVVVASAEAEPDAEERALAAGAQAYFAKPFSPALVRTKIEELIDAANSRDTAADRPGAAGRNT